jgi:hypothetical protein
MTEKEVHEMRDLQGQEVARIFGRDVAVEFGRAGEIPAEPGARRVQVHALPLQRVADVPLGRRQRLRHALFAAALAGRRQQSRLEAVPHHEGRIVGERLVDGGHGIRSVIRELHDRVVVQVQRNPVSGRNRVTKPIFKKHGVLQVT